MFSIPQTPQASRPHGSGLRALQRAFFLLGVALIGFFVIARLDSLISPRVALWAFAQAPDQPSLQEPQLDAVSRTGSPDLSLWSLQRINAYKKSLALKMDRPLGVLTIPRLHLVAPVFEGTDSLTLNRGLGRIRGTAMLGGDGNVGIAGHRDGFFRPLQSVALGDAIEITTSNGHDRYVVDRINIVDPEDTGVLKSSQEAELTLVTCYPFHFIGDAPRRYIVQASLKQRGQLIPASPIEPAQPATTKEK